MTCFLLKMSLKILLNYSSTLGTDSSKNLVQGVVVCYAQSSIRYCVELYIEKVYLIGGWIDRLVGDRIIYR